MKNQPIELPVSELRLALPGMGKLIGRRTTLPVLSAVRVSRDQAGVITIQGTDLDSTATFTLKDKDEGPATHILVPFDRLQKAMKQSSSKVELSLNPKDEVVIRTFWRDTPMEEKIHVPYNDDWPKQVVVDGEPVKLPENFRATFKEAMECASEDTSRPVINSVYLDVDDQKGHYVVATNGRHLFSANSFAFGFKQSVVIPTRKFLEWNGWWNEGEATLAIKPPAKKEEFPWLQFKVNQWTFTTRGCPEQYPKWKNVVPAEEYRTTVTIPEQAVASVLEVLARLPGADDPNKGVTLNVAKDTLVLSGRSKDQAQPVSVPILDAQIKGADSKVTLNREYLARALKFGLLEINLVDELTPIVFQSKGRKMIVMPLRPDGPAPAKAPSSPTPPPTTSTSTNPPTEQQERTTMPKQTTTTTTEPQESPLKQLIQQIENIKASLKTVMNDLSDALSVVKQAEKEKRLADKEIEAIREKVREIQSVTI
jgi:exonuclease VII small subunit